MSAYTKVTAKLIGYKHSEEARKNMSIGKLKSPTRYWKDKNLSDDTKEKISNSLKGKKQSKETIDKRVNSLKKLTTDQEVSMRLEHNEYIQIHKKHGCVKKSVEILSKKYKVCSSKIRKIIKG
jgi:hypothetical protein